MIEVAHGVWIDPRELDESFIRAGGPGGQNVNKVATAVQLRFDILRSPSLPDAVRERALRLAGRRLTQDGVLVITAQRFRTQDRNRQDAQDRLVALLAEAAAPPPPKRRATRPTLGSKVRRIEGKSKRGTVKKLRGRVGEE